MENGSMLFDASSCMLFEASGDSEAACFDTAVEEELGPTEAEDDALSCSCSWFSDSAAVHEIEAGGDELYSANFDGFVEEDDDGCETEVEDGVVDQCCGGSKAAVRGDANMKLMGEGETDRLFWEACLTS